MMREIYQQPEAIAAALERYDGATSFGWKIWRCGEDFRTA